ncbi:hypothetical protein BV25DRAFT_1831264 [Artomyces pyxidatus]|uniref:Uncharacterized protein n=1 Tax=Artomyces pyxidatus TaxID=48021 RepID=A0ACB8SN18_9AGAM|nr:hypothetical protein BV25DRAFT_1831264 [Artomyces pyxidatus]
MSMDQTKTGVEPSPRRSPAVHPRPLGTCDQNAEPVTASSRLYHAHICMAWPRPRSRGCLIFLQKTSCGKYDSEPVREPVLSIAHELVLRQRHKKHYCTVFLGSPTWVCGVQVDSPALHVPYIP